MAAPAHIQHLKNNLGINVHFWGVDPSTATAAHLPKTKLMELHPVKPWILTVDVAGNISLVDYSLKKTILSDTVSALISTTNDTHSDRRGMSLTYDQRCLSSMSNSFRAPKRRNGASSRLFDDFEKPEIEQYSAADEAKISGTHVKQKNVSGLARQVSFTDKLSVQFNTGHSVPDTGHQFNRDICYLVVSDHTVIFRDATSKQTRTLTALDLAKAHPTCAEFIYFDICAVGCSDGHIRLWDCKRWMTRPRDVRGERTTAAMVVTVSSPPLRAYGQERLT